MNRVYWHLCIHVWQHMKPFEIALCLGYTACVGSDSNTCACCTWFCSSANTCRIVCWPTTRRMHLSVPKTKTEYTLACLQLSALNSYKRNFKTQYVLFLEELWKILYSALCKIDSRAPHEHFDIPLQGLCDTVHSAIKRVLHGMQWMSNGMLYRGMWSFFWTYEMIFQSGTTLISAKGIWVGVVEPWCSVSRFWWGTVWYIWVDADGAAE